MIANNYTSNQKISRKLLPKSFKTRVIIIGFIASDDDVGISLYKNNQQYSPINYIFDIDFDCKLKCKTFADLENFSANNFKNNREYIKQAKGKFETEFSTKIELEDVADRYVYVEQLISQNDIFAFKNLDMDNELIAQNTNDELKAQIKTCKFKNHDKKCVFKKQNKIYSFEKQIFCIIKQCEEIEHTINPEFVRDCVVVPLNDFQQFISKNSVADFCIDFVYNFR